jgi:hypothetical protein
MGQKYNCQRSKLCIIPMPASDEPEKSEINTSTIQATFF